MSSTPRTPTTRRQWQSLAKRHDIPANLSTATIRARLVDLGVPVLDARVPHVPPPRAPGSPERDVAAATPARSRKELIAEARRVGVRANMKSEEIARAIGMVEEARRRAADGEEDSERRQSVEGLGGASGEAPDAPEENDADKTPEKKKLLDLDQCDDTPQKSETKRTPPPDPYAQENVASHPNDIVPLSRRPELNALRSPAPAIPKSYSRRSFLPQLTMKLPRVALLAAHGKVQLTPPPTDRQLEAERRRRERVKFDLEASLLRKPTWPMKISRQSLPRL